MTDAESLACDAILEALTREGPRPSTHRLQIARLRGEWPTLYNALVRLAEARQVSLPPLPEVRPLARPLWPG